MTDPSDRSGAVDGASEGGSGAHDRRRFVAAIVVVAVGLGAFGVTAAIRSGGDDVSSGAEIAPDDSAPGTTAADDGTTEDSLSGTTEGTDEAGPVTDDGPTVDEVELAVVAPIEADESGVPLAPPDDYEGPGSVDAVVSPVIGTTTAGVVVDGDRSVAAPAPYADLVGSAGVPVDDLIAPPALDADLDEVGPPEPVPVPDEVDVDAVLDSVEDLADGYDADAAADPDDAAGAGERDDSPAAPGGDTGSDTDDAPRLVDPCADAADADDPERCPDPGEPGTIVETFALTVPPPLRVRIEIPAGDLCGPVDTTRFEQRMAVESTTPLTSFEMRYWRSGWPTEEYTRTISLSTPTATADTWLDEFEASTTDPPAPVVHCATLTDLRPGWSFQLHAEVVDVFDREWSTYGRTPPYFRGPDAEIPPTHVWRLSDSELLVSAPHRADQAVAIMAYRRNGEFMDFPIDPCAGTSRLVDGFDLPESPIRPSLVDVSPIRLGELGYDPDYVHRTIGTMRLRESSQYRLCVHTSTTRPSFSVGLEQTLGYDVRTPDSLAMTFSVLRIDAEGSGGLPADALTVDVSPVGRGIMVGHPWCGSWRNPEAIEGETAIDATICTSDPSSGELFDSGARLSMTATGVDGVRRESSVVIPIRSCRMPCVVPAPEVYRFELPTGRTSYDFFCGLFGDGCESADENESFGTIAIEVSYDNDVGSLEAGWTVDEPQELGDRRSAPPPTPRLDTQQSPFTSGSTAAPRLTVPILADRPVTATVDLRESYDGEPVCMVGDGPTVASSDEFSESHEITIDGLCPGQTVVPIVELTDEAGESSRWHAMTGDADFGPAETWNRGHVRVREMILLVSADVSVDVPSDAVRFPRFELSVSGQEIGWDRFIEHDGRGCQVPRGDPVEVGSRRGRNLPDERVTIFTDRSVEVELVVLAELLLPGCADAVGDQPDAFTVSGVVDWDDVELGVPIEFTGRVAVPDLGPDAFIDTTLLVTIHGFTR